MSRVRAEVLTQVRWIKFHNFLHELQEMVFEDQPRSHGEGKLQRQA